MKHPRTQSIKSCLIGAAFILASCGGSGTNAVDTRTLSGSVATESNNNVSLLTEGDISAQQSTLCAADTILATTTGAETTQANVADDCSFSLELTIGESYAISFVRDNNFVASLVFDTGIPGFSGSSLFVDDSGDTIDLGSITINGSTAIPSNNPLSYHDRDDDDTPDYLDEDDDGDGVLDTEEVDCDFDGILDDDDDDSDCETPAENERRVLRVKPHPGREDVHLDRDVRLLIGCRVDPDSVSADSFSVVSENDDAVECEYKLVYHFKGQGPGRRIAASMLRCRHDEDPFAPNSEYTITTDGLTCLNGDPVQNISVSFTTEDIEDEDSEEYGEDDFDDELEAEDDGEDIEDAEDVGDDEYLDEEDEDSDDSEDEDEDEDEGEDSEDNEEEA